MRDEPVVGIGVWRGPELRRVPTNLIATIVTSTAVPWNNPISWLKVRIFSKPDSFTMLHFAQSEPDHYKQKSRSLLRKQPVAVDDDARNKRCAEAKEPCCLL